MKKMETSKILALYLFILLTGILIYSMVVMWQFQDLTALPTMITDIGAQILVYAIYCLKSYKAKSSEEEMKLKRDKFEAMLQAAAENKKKTGIDGLDEDEDEEDDSVTIDSEEENQGEEEENNG